MYKMLGVGFITLLSFSTILNASNETLSDLVAKQSQMEEELRELRGKLEEIEHLTRNLPQSHGELQKSPISSTYPTGSAHPAALTDMTDDTAFESGGKHGGSEILVNPDEKGSVQEQYNQARDLVMHRKYAEALALFNTIIRHNPSDTIVVDAHYWIGEIRFIQTKFEEAAIAYADSYQNLNKFKDIIKNPIQTKAPNALIQLARSFRKLGQTEKSQEILAQYKKIFGDNQTKSLEKQYERAQKEISPQDKIVGRT